VEQTYKKGSVVYVNPLVLYGITEKILFFIQNEGKHASLLL